MLWQAQTVLREQRGDGHVAALLTAGLDPVESLVLFAADNAMDGAWMRNRRGWTEEEWAAAVDRLVERGLAAGRDRALTEAGRALRAEVEAHTDALADAAWAGRRAAPSRLTELVAPLVAAIIAGDGFLRANPMGLRPLGPRRGG